MSGYVFQRPFAHPYLCNAVILPVGRYRVTFDNVDVALAKTKCWHMDRRGRVTSNELKPVPLTRFLFGDVRPDVWDHINGDPLDNRRCNIRRATKLQNNYNRKTWSSTGFKGVRATHCVSKPYRAVIRVDGKAKHLGYYKTPQEANTAYHVAAVAAFGEFACSER